MNTTLKNGLLRCAAADPAACMSCPYFISDPCMISLAYNLYGYLTVYHPAGAAHLIKTLRGYLDSYEGLSDASLSEDDLPDLFRQIYDYLKESDAYEEKP